MSRVRPLWIILAAAILLRLLAALAIEPFTVSGDEANWNGVARAFLISGVVHPDPGTYWPPLYPLMLAGVYTLFPGGTAAVQVVQALLGGLTCLPIFWVGQRLAGRRAGLVSAALCAVYPLFIVLSAALMAETLLILVVCSALVAFVLAVEKPTAARCGLMGFALGLGVLTKPVVLAWAPLLLIGLWRHTRPGDGHRLLGAAVAAAAMVVTIAPWTARNFAVTGRLVPVSSNLGVNLLIGCEPAGVGVYRHGAAYHAMADSLAGGGVVDEVTRDRVATRWALGRLADDPVRTLRLAAVKLAWLWGPLVPGASLAVSGLLMLAYLPVLVLGGIGLWHLRGSVPAWGILSLAAALSAVHAIVFAHTRFRLPADALLMAPAGWTVCRAWRCWGPNGGNPGRAT